MAQHVADPTDKEHTFRFAHGRRPRDKAKAKASRLACQVDAAAGSRTAAELAAGQHGPAAGVAEG